MTKPLDPERPGRPARLAALLAALALALAPHALRVPAWVSCLTLAFGAWRFLLEARGGGLPSRWFLSIAALAGFAAVFLGTSHSAPREAALAVLVFLSGLKLLEMASPRDWFLTVLLGYFLVAANFLYSESIPTAAGQAVVAVLLTGVWVGASDERDAGGFAADLRLGVTMLCHAGPLVLILFLLFPRIQGHLWGMSLGDDGGLTGLSDRMAPGTIGRLQLSESVAFRVKFVGAVPPDRYWRGIVLENTDGVSWSRGAGSGALPNTEEPFRSLGQPVEYSVTLEPHGLPWLFALDLPASVPAGAFLAADFTMQSRRPVRERVRYLQRSELRYDTGALTPDARSRALDVPAGVSDRVRALAEGWRTHGRSPGAIVDLALRQFHEAPFFYTLTPPVARRDPVDEFLFETRSGYCEHYAGAFTLLMRLAGIPARVVTGYEGGEHNALGDYWIVRQRDAHAWSEVWLPRRGWVRVDPTQAVAPERVDASVAASFVPRLGSFALSRTGLIARGLRGIRNAWDWTNSSWNQWVLGYDQERQFALLSRLGFDSLPWPVMSAAISAALGLVLAALGLRMFRRRAPANPLLRAYGCYCRKLARRGILRLPHEGPWAYALRVSALREDLADAVWPITSLYVRLRYGPDPARDELRDLQRKVKRFRP